VVKRGRSIGIVAQGWFPDPGGVESHTRDLARELQRRGHRVHALALDYSGECAPYELRRVPADGVELTRLAYLYHDHRALADVVRNARAEELAVRWAREAGVELVHVHHPTGFGLGLLPALKAAGLPVVMTLHDYWALCPRGQMLRADGGLCAAPEPETCARCLAATWPQLLPSGGGEARGPRGEALATDAEAAAARTAYALEALSAADRLLTPSRAARAVFARAGLPAERVTVVENGIDVSGLAAEVARLRALEPERGDEVRLGVLGSVLPSKGALELAEAVREADVPGLTLEVHGSLPSYHGDTRYVDALRALAAEDPRVRVHGPYAHDRLPAVLAGLDAVAAPSRWAEVYGLTVREARAAGLPVLVGDAGDLPSVLGPGEEPLAADDRAAWVAALRRLAADVRAARAAGTARGRSAPGAAPRGAEEMAQEIEAVYLALLGRGPETGPWKRLFRRALGYLGAR